MVLRTTNNREITMAKIFSKIAIIALAIHLWFANEELLTKTDSDVSNYVWYIVALAYSIIGANAVLTTNKVLPIIAFAIMDGCAIHFKINPPESYNLVIGWFYAIYTAYIILITWYMEQSKAKTAIAEAPKEEPDRPPMAEAREQEKPQPAIEAPKEESREVVQLELPIKVDDPNAITYDKAIAVVRGKLNGKSTREEKVRKIEEYVMSIPNEDVREEMKRKTHFLYACQYD